MQILVSFTRRDMKRVTVEKLQEVFGDLIDRGVLPKAIDADEHVCAVPEVVYASSLLKRNEVAIINIKHLKGKHYVLQSFLKPSLNSKGRDFAIMVANALNAALKEFNAVKV